MNNIFPFPNDALILLYELATELAPAAITAAILSRKAKQLPTSATVLTYGTFALYIAAVLHITGAGTIHDGLLRGFGSRGQYNLVPFVNGADPTQLLLNAALFVPFGCFFGKALGRRAPHDFLTKKRASACKRTAMNLAKTAAGSFAFSLAIETSQLLNNRTFDIDDLVMNTLGGCIGFAIALAAARLMQDSALRRRTARTALQRNRGCTSTRPRRNGVTIAFSGIAAAAFLGRFALFNELAAAGMLYGF